MTDVNKEITVEQSTTTATLTIREAVLASSKLLATVFDKVDWDAGVLLYPYSQVPKAGESNHMISGMELTKDSDITTKEIVKETVEDAHPGTKMRSTLETIMVQETSQKIEKLLLDKFLTDTNIPVVSGAAADWTGIEKCIATMGTHVFNTVGSFIVVVALTDYLALVRDTDYKRAMDILGGKVRLVLSTSLTVGQMVVMHEHGVAGAAMIKEMEIDKAPSSDLATLVLPYRTGLSYDTDYVRVVK